VNNETNINDRIPVCIDCSTSDLLTTDDRPGVFVGVVRRKGTFSFYIGNIDQKSTKSDIVKYIVSKGDTFVFYFFLNFLLSHYTYNILQIY
jgi:hypothetical protein